MLTIILDIIGGFISVLIGSWFFTNTMEYVSSRYRLVLPSLVQYYHQF
ncbi:hypothetical protein [Vulcanisaeta distributa]|nr:hypothetical protein [Vulcanisaeta distributa]